MTVESKLSALAHKVRIGQFVSVGAIGATIETVIIAIMTTSVGLAPLAAKAIGAEFSISTMFFINDQWTFASQGASGPVAFIRRWVRSHFVRTTGLFVGFFVLHTLTNKVQLSVLIGGADLWPTVANLIGISLGMVINYVAECLITWQVSHSDAL